MNELYLTLETISKAFFHDFNPNSAPGESLDLWALTVGMPLYRHQKVGDFHQDGVPVADQVRFLEDRGGRIVVVASHTITATWPHTSVMVSLGNERSTHSSIRIESVDPVFSKKIFDEMSVWIHNQEPRSVYTLSKSSDGFSMDSLGKMDSVLEEENYRPEVVTAVRAISAGIKNPNPIGRIAILHGPPGSGKTYIIRSLISSIPGVQWVVVPQPLYAHLGDPDVISCFSTTKACNKLPIVLVLEDADNVLAPRMADNASIVSSVLNLSDGILGQLLDIRILCTSNSELHEVDQAILRPGRLLKQVEVGLLDAEQAEAVHQRLVGRPAGFSAKGFFSLAEVYSTALGGEEVSEHEHAPGRKVGFR